jgi:hypothetical protein
VLSNLVSLINAQTNLAGADGITAEDFHIPSFGNPTANFIARSPGRSAAGLKVSLTSNTMGTTPSAATALTDNLSDLQPRNHLYLTAGATTLGGNYSLNTALLGDGFHKLTAVAYEGSHVRTQTRISIPIRVQNTPLSASLITTNLADTNPVSGNYQLSVIANTNNISTVTLFTTGGVFASVTNQSNANFSVSAATLGVGQHSFYAVARDSLGRTFKTASRTIRFQ